MADITGNLKPLRNVVLVTDMESGARVTNGGIIIGDDNMKDRGIRPRWSQVYAVGPEVDDLKPGQWVYVEHGRWSFGFDFKTQDGQTIKLWQVEYPKSVMLVSDENPIDTKSL